MDIQPSIDLKKVNLQTAVGYLVSLHENEYEWNLLGLKVVGVAATADDIPAVDYKYGDVYEVGTEPPYDMYVYTRPDGKVHTEGYWFNLGKFPLPGPKGPRGDGIGQITYGLIGGSTTQKVNYDTDNGFNFITTGLLQYKDSDTGKTENRNYPMNMKLPIIPGKYISMDATSDNKNLEIKVDDTELSLDYYKVAKTDEATVPAYSPTVGRTNIPYSYVSKINSLVRRGIDGEVEFNFFNANYWRNPSNFQQTITFDRIWQQLGKNKGFISVAKTTSDTGIITAGTLSNLQSFPQIMIQYDNQTYYRMDPANAPDGTLNYIHIDSVQDGNGGYKATGKCFSITVSTRAWQVVDIDFTSKTTYTHFITLTDNVSGTVMKLTVNNQISQAMTESELAPYIRAPGDQGYPCNTIIKTVSSDTGNYQPAYLEWITGAATYYTLNTGTARKTYTPNQLSIIDRVVSNI